MRYADVALALSTGMHPRRDLRKAMTIEAGIHASEYDLARIGSGEWDPGPETEDQIVEEYLTIWYNYKLLIERN